MKRKTGILFAFIILTVSLLFSFSAYASDEACNYNVSLSNSQYSYTGSIQRPRVYVKDENGNDLSSDQYTVVYNTFTSTDPGEYTITVTGKGDYYGVTEASYNIRKRHINDGTSIDFEYPQGYYNGSSVCPKVIISVNGNPLTEDEDYVLSYTNNVEMGRAYVEISGLDNFIGKTTRSFIIGPDAVTNLKFTDKSLTSVKLTWNRKSDIDGYAVYSYENGKYVLKQTVSGAQNTQATVTLPSGHLYQLAVCAYKNIEGKNYYGELSQPVTAYTLVDRYVSGAILRRNDNSPSAQVLIHSVSGASGYQLMYSPDPNFKKYTSIVTNEGLNITFYVNGYYRNLPMYARVRAFLDTPDGRIYGAWSDSVNDFRYSGRVRTDKPYNSSSMRVQFDKSVYGTGYEILYSTSSDFRSGNNKYLSYGLDDLDETIHNLRRDRSYYVKVRPFYTLGSDYYYGPYGSVSTPEFYYVFATYSSKYVNNANRTTNLRIAAAAINGTVIMPGETFDFNKVVGPRTAERGYKKATVFTGNKGTAQELGGGICQIASTLFNTCLYADVDITERHQHSQKVSYVPLGRDAAISGEYKNFRWTNNYDFPIKIYMDVSGGYVTCTFYTQNSEDPGNIDLKVTKNGNTYTLRRYHNGSVDYTCTSRF